MHKFKADNDSVDFDFFDTDEGNSKPFASEKNNSSKIITKAVIEAKPKEIVSRTSSPKSVKSLKLDSAYSSNGIKAKTNGCISSPTSSEEKRLLGQEADEVALFNCLAYSDDNNDSQTYCMDEKYFSDNSLSDSTITTVTSDFTTVSHMSSMSDSSCGSDLSNDSSNPQNVGCICNDNSKHFDDNAEDIDIKSNIQLLGGDDKNNVSKPLNNESDVSFEQIVHDNDHKINGNGDQVHVKNLTTDLKEEDESSNENCASKTTNIYDSIFCKNESRREPIENQELSQSNSLSRKESSSNTDLEERLGDISLASHSSSNSSMGKLHTWRGQNRFRSKKKELNLTFSREELIRIERDNTILLKKIMAYSKPRSVSLNHSFSHKKTSAAINRARQQKKIEQDNYILYSKINAMNRMKKVF